MKIQVTSLAEGESIVLHHTYNPEHEDVQFEDCVFTADVVFDGEARKEAGCIFITGTVSSTAKRICVRCLESVEESFERTVSCTVEYTGEDVDITEDIREALIFEHPIQFVCSSACKGLCPACGVNLNEQECACNSHNDDNVFSQLKERLKNKEN